MLEHRDGFRCSKMLVSFYHKQVHLLAYDAKILAEYNHRYTKTYNAQRFKAQMYATDYISNQTI